ncbi:MAG: hypothetical protein IPJ87_01425 [Flavobacteriales bacterium]|nr:hypothetical protein [Flavobacteriales bacterium]
MYGPPLFCALALWSAQAQANISFTIAPEHCSNADGSVNATVTGGVPPYSYSWSSGPTSEDIHGLPAGSYTLTVTDFLGAVQQNTAVVPNLPGWEWDPGQGLAQAIPSCNGDPGGLILFGGDIPSYPLGPGPHQNDAGCVMQVQLQDLPADVQLFGISTMCYWGAPGQIYAVNYTDVNGCPGYMEAIVPQPPQFYPVSIRISKVRAPAAPTAMWRSAFRRRRTSSTGCIRACSMINGRPLRHSPTWPRTGPSAGPTMCRTSHRAPTPSSGACCTTRISISRSAAVETPPTSPFLISVPPAAT